MPAAQALPPQQASDTALLHAIRNGDKTAFSELWKRYSRVAHSIAYGFSGSLDPEDLVAESYTRVFAILLRGGGPQDDFLAYLATTIKNTARRWGSVRREHPTEALDSLPLEDNTFASFETRHDEQFVAKRAFATLPESWRQVIWETEVEGHTPKELAARRGTTPNAVSALLYRAKEALSDAWIAQHVSRTHAPVACHATLTLLPKYVRKRLTAQERQAAERHLAECPRCREALDEARRVAHHLRALLLPGIPLGLGAGAGVAHFTSGTPASALSAPGGIPSPEAAFPPGASPTTTPTTTPSAGSATHAAASAPPPLPRSALHTLDTLHSVPGRVTKLLCSALVSMCLALSLSGQPPPPTSEPSPIPAPVAPSEPGSPDSPDNPGNPGRPDNPGTPELLASSEPAPPLLAPHAAHPVSLAGALRVAPGATLPTGPRGPSTARPPSGVTHELTAPTFDFPPGWIFSGEAAPLTGTAHPESTVVAYVSGRSIGFMVVEAPVDSSGRWAAPLLALPDGDFTVRGMSVNDLEQRSALTSSWFRRLASPCVPPPSIVSLDTEGGRYAPIVQGQALPGAVVELRVNTALFLVRSSPLGTWQFHSPDSVQAGTNTIFARQRSPHTQEPSAPSEPRRFSIEVPTITGDTAPSGEQLIVVEGRAEWGVLVEEGSGRFSHFLSAPNPAHPISPHANNEDRSPVTGIALTARYSSADRRRLGALTQPVAPSPARDSAIDSSSTDVESSRRCRPHPHKDPCPNPTSTPTPTPTAKG